MASQSLPGSKLGFQCKTVVAHSGFQNVYHILGNVNFLNYPGHLKSFLHLAKGPNLKTASVCIGVTDSLMGNVQRPVRKHNKGPLLDR